MARKIMFLGTASSVGKSTVSTAFCRYFKNKGYKVAPFKALNISLNSFVTDDGMEMGRAQAVQAEACEILPKAIMNPVLLKPSENMQTQVIINGKVDCDINAYDYVKLSEILRKKVIESFNNIEKDYDLIVLEGSGSCCEINLKKTDIANMYMAKSSNSPVILVADIDRGGVFASIYGTIMLLDDDERRLIKGVIINKFRGSVEHFKPAMKQLEDIIKIPVLGVLPYSNIDIEDEDSVTERFNKFNKNYDLDIVIIKLRYMSNFTDFNVLETIDSIRVRYVDKKNDIKNPHLIIIPGSKNTISDLKFIKENGIFDEINKLRKKGTIIFGICGGYQMLGQSIDDENKIETSGENEFGFGFLKMKTIFNKDKITRQNTGFIYSNTFKNCNLLKICGYEIHNGESVYSEKNNIFIEDENKNILGLTSDDGKVIGTYFHGIFDNKEFVVNFIKDLKKFYNIKTETKDVMDYKTYKLKEYDKLSLMIEENLDMKKIEEIIF